MLRFVQRSADCFTAPTEGGTSRMGMQGLRPMPRPAPTDQIISMLDSVLK